MQPGTWQVFTIIMKGPEDSCSRHKNEEGQRKGKLKIKMRQNAAGLLVVK